MGTFGAAVSVSAGYSAIAHTDLKQAASSAAVLLAPLTYSSTYARVVLFGPDVSGFYVRARGIVSARVADPVVNIYMLYYRDGNVTRVQPGDTSIAQDGTILFDRVFEQNAITANFTLPLTTTTLEGDGTYKYSPRVVAGVPTWYSTSVDSTGSAKGVPAMSRASAFGVIVLAQTAGNVTLTSGNLEAQVIAV